MTETPRPLATRGREGTRPPPFVFTYRCPQRLIGPLNEGRFILRESSRTALISKAIEAYLRARGIPMS